LPGQEGPRYEVALPTIMRRVRDLALAQSEDITERVLADGVRVVLGRGRGVGPNAVEGRPPGDGGGGGPARGGGGRGPERLGGAAILLAPGSDPRRMDTAPTDGEVILSSQDVYRLRQ